MKPRAPIYPGHEPAGVVVAVGEGIEQFAVGQRVFMHHHVPCMVCHCCQRGAFSQCSTFRATRLYPGGLAEYVRVLALNLELDVLPLPDNVSLDAATLIEPLACCVRGINRAAIRPGDCVLVLGAGSNGLMLAQLAQQRGAVRVMIADPIAYRRQRALAVGIDYALNPQAEAPLVEQIYALNDGLKPDIVLGTPSSISAIRQGLELLVPAARVLRAAYNPAGLRSPSRCAAADRREQRETGNTRSTRLYLSAGRAASSHG